MYTCFLDISKAFERVCHKILLNKLAAREVPSFIVNMFAHIFNNTEVCVCYNDCFSDRWKISRGVRQDGVTSAILFNIFMDDILSEINKVNVGCRLGITKVNIQAYAVNIPTVSGLQKLMSRMSDLLECHQLVVNANKTKIVVFNRQSRDFTFRFINTV